MVRDQGTEVVIEVTVVVGRKLKSTDVSPVQGVRTLILSSKLIVDLGQAGLLPHEMNQSPVRIIAMPINTNLHILCSSCPSRILAIDSWDVESCPGGVCDSFNSTSFLSNKGLGCIHLGNVSQLSSLIMHFVLDGLVVVGLTLLKLINTEVARGILVVDNVWLSPEALGRSSQVVGEGGIVLIVTVDG